jgi:hypothetical protein
MKTSPAKAGAQKTKMGTRPIQTFTAFTAQACTMGAKPANNKYKKAPKRGFSTEFAL